MDDETGEPKEIATITLSDWDSLKKDGAYRFEIKYHGANAMENGQCVSKEEPPAKELERYDDHGRIYTYVLKETAIGNATLKPSNWPEGVYEDGFASTNGNGGYILRNNYKENQGGEITFDKYLYLPGEAVGSIFEPSTYPAVTFELWRTYDYGDEGGSLAEPPEDPIKTLTISSEKVKKAFEDAKDNPELQLYANKGLIKLTAAI